MRILYLSRWFPFPTDNGVKMRLFQLIKALAEAHTVDLISFCDQTPDLALCRPLTALCRRIETVPYRPFNPNRLRAVAGFLADRPRWLLDTFQPEMAAKVARAFEKGAYDLVIADEIDMAPYAEALKGTARLFEGPEVSFYLDGLEPFKMGPAVLRKQATWWKLSGYLKKLINEFDGWSVVSEQERNNLMRISPQLAQARIVPNGADLERRPARPVTVQPGKLIYAGSLTYQANFDAVSYFLAEIFPLILKKHPETRFYVTGNTDGVDVSRLPACPKLVLTGRVEDIAAEVAESWMSVVPLRLGSGTRLKILESLSLGTPVVSTSKGSQGLDLVPGSHLLVGDEPAAFAAQVNRLLDSSRLRDQLSQQGRRQVQQKYDWKHIGAAFREFAEDVSRQHPHFERQVQLSQIQSRYSNKYPNGKHP